MSVVIVATGVLLLVGGSAAFCFERGHELRTFATAMMGAILVGIGTYLWYYF